MATWMLVEDEPDMYTMVLAMYEIMGVHGMAFTNGNDALNWLDALDDGQIGGELPELALIDIRLPGFISGPQVGARLRQSPALRQIAIVLMTAYSLSPQQEREMVAQAGANLLLYKPLPSHNILKQMLQEIIVH
ncbi:MAG TPA: response regulator [Phototrophicaceae bacterium]|nr:response regulator [Phototrophicaceae bacterium]